MDSPKGKRANGPVRSPGQGAWHSDLESLRDVLTSSVIAVLAFDTSLTLQLFTPAAATLFDVADADIGRHLGELPKKFTNDELVGDAQSVVEAGVSLLREVGTQSGALYNQRLLPFRDPAGNIKGVVITFADISEMLLIRRAIDDARAYSNSIVDAIRLPMVMLDHEHRVLSASLPFYRSFAISPEEAVGIQLFALNDGLFDVPPLRAFLKLIDSDNDFSAPHEVKINLPHRGPRILALTPHRVSSVGVLAERVLLVIEDITDRKLIESDLTLAKRQAEIANLGKSRFLAAASHDLRQPLQTMTLLQSMLVKKAADPESERLVAKLGESLDVMAAILNKLLDITQLEAGVVKPEIGAVHVGALLARIRDDFSYRAESKGLTCRAVNTQFLARSDPTLLEQMIRNLVSNAVKYTGSGKILLGCRKRGLNLRIEVWDTGTGIPAAQLHAVFEEFHQLDNPARERSRGLGLGLSIVQRLAELLGHHVDVQSTPGKGSIFSITLPHDSSSVNQEVHPKAYQTTARRARRDLILLVEDDPAIRETLKMLFVAEGFLVADAIDGQSALDLVANHACRPAILVTDYNLPNSMTGINIAERLRELLGHSLPVIIVTGDISAATLKAIAQASCNKLIKPVKPEELVSLIQTQIETMRQGPKLAASPIVKGQRADGSAAPKSVYLVDDNDGLRQSMATLIRSSGLVVEAYPSSETFLQAFKPGGTACLVIDACLPGMDGLALLRHLRVEGWNLPAIMITGFGDIAMAVDAMKAGAIDFMEKPVSGAMLLESIGRAIDLSRGAKAHLDWLAAAARRLASLTVRERQIMDLVIAGRPNKIISADLKLSQRTVEKHRASIMHKTNSSSLCDLVRLAMLGSQAAR